MVTTEEKPPYQRFEPWLKQSGWTKHPTEFNKWEKDGQLLLITEIFDNIYLKELQLI